MNYDQFTILPAALKLNIIKKCYPIPYVRLRRSCRFLDEFCEQNRLRLGIYCYQKFPHLYLLNTLNLSPFKRPGSEQKTLDKPHIVINYGREDGTPGFLVPMTKENIPRIRESLSGFAFTHATIDSWTGFAINNKQEFGEAIASFLEVAAEFHISFLVISYMSVSEAETIVTTWKTVETVIFNCPSKCWDVLQLDCIKNIKSLHFTFRQLRNQPIICERTIQELALGRELVRFYAKNLDRTISRLALENIIKSWKEEGKWPGTFCYAYSEARTYYEADIFEEWHPLMPTDAIYFGSYIQPLRSKKLMKLDIWLFERPDDSIYQLFYITRTNYEEAHCETDYHLLTSTSKNDLITLFIGLLDYIYMRHPLDYSGIYEEMTKCDTLTEKSAKFSQFWESIATAYTKRAPKRQTESIEPSGIGSRNKTKKNCHCC